MAFRAHRSILASLRSPLREANRVDKSYPVADLPPRTVIAPKATTRLPDLVQQAYPVLYDVKTVFPFVIFADRIIVRTNHVDIVRGEFFGSYSNIRVLIPDIKQLIISYIPFLATLEIVPTGPLEQVVKVTHLPVAGAQRAKRIIAGLIESHQKQVDFSRYSPEEIATSMEAIGKAGDGP